MRLVFDNEFVRKHDSVQGIQHGVLSLDRSQL
jgi:hypothetical protein